MCTLRVLSLGWAVAAAACAHREGAATPRAGQAAGPPLDPTRGTVFPERSVPGLLEQCSRATPDDVVGYWTPTAGQVRALEAALAATLGPADYYRQYGGIVHRGGRRTIYVNGFPRRDVEAEARFLAENRDHPERLTHFPPGYRDANWWRGVPVVACDGGDVYFGVEFDPATGRFEALHFNGHA